MNTKLGTLVKKTEGDVADEERVDLASATADQRQAIQMFGQAFAVKCIKFSTDYRWLPTQTTCGADEGMVAAPMPPHKCFDVKLAIPDDEHEELLLKWQKACKKAVDGGVVKKDNTLNMIQFTMAVHDFRVLMVFPCLERIMNESKDVKAELAAGLTNASAQKLLKRSEGHLSMGIHGRD